jgi:tRNA(fMet)-specific endonuclease VapC
MPQRVLNGRPPALKLSACLSYDCAGNECRHRGNQPTCSKIWATLLQTLMDGTIVGIPSNVLFKTWYGIKKSARSEDNAANLSAFLALDLTHWPFEHDDIKEAGDIRALLERAGTPIGPYDTLIAAQARRRGATIVTVNTREFARVPGLKMEDWT